MCGFAGFSDYSDSLTEEKYLWMALARRMTSKIVHRGPDGRGEHVSPYCALGHARLAIMDPEHGAQPMSFFFGGQEFTIAYNGEIYNAGELRRELTGRGFSFETDCDTEVVLKSYICFKEACCEKLNGIFAFAVDDTAEGRTFLCRDRFGVKPLFYSLRDGRLVFASEIKALFEYPGLNPAVGPEGLCEIFGLGPARTPGCGVFKGINELKPGCFAVFDREGFREIPYFRLTARKNTDSYEAAVERVRELLTDTVNRQLVSDVPVCTFLSGGLDSSVISAIAAKALKEKGRRLSTYSFEFEDNDVNFRPSSFQPERDEGWARLVSEYIGSEHSTLICESRELYDSIYSGVIARDLPGMADVDGSLLRFCGRVRKRHHVALCGECADEVFGGYPWFSRREMYDGRHFPWSDNLDERMALVRPELLKRLDMEEYVNARFAESLKETPLSGDETADERRMKEIGYLSIRWFMATLLDRKDRCSMFNGLEVRVPYADHRLIEYVYNTPWEYKYRGGRRKGLLRDAAAGLLPGEILERRKSPYPKTYDPGYESKLKHSLSKLLDDSSQPIHRVINTERAKALCGEAFDYGKPWFGQLMAGPQLIAYLLQINYWLAHYDIELKL